MLVWDREVPSGATFDPNLVARAVEDGRIPLPSGDTVNSVATAAYPAGAAVLVDLTSQGRSGRVAVMIVRGREWVFTLTTGGSSKAVSDFDHMMRRLTLP